MSYDANLAIGWVWVTAGCVWGFVLGLGFHQELWLGGYTSFRRRLYRLAHISFFGLAILNLLFYFTATGIRSPSGALHVASWCFLIGALCMPASCFVTAHWPKLRAVFAAPVITLTLASVLTCWEVIRQ